MRIFSLPLFVYLRRIGNKNQYRAFPPTFGKCLQIPQDWLGTTTWPPQRRVETRILEQIILTSKTLQIMIRQ